MQHKKGFLLPKRLPLAQMCERTFEVGERSEVGVLEITTFQNI